MTQASSDTIFALSSAAGRAGVSLFRLSGPEAERALSALTERALPRPRLAALRTLRHEGEVIDEALVLRMPGPHSFTGEDVVELTTHGSPAVIEAVSRALLSVGLRQAAPGEFTRRAFLNARLDLMEAEGLADLIDADTEAQRRQALRQMRGGLSERAEGWKEQLLDGCALVEGEIDFPDEQDVPDRLSREAGPGLRQLQAELSDALAGFERGERVRDGLRIAIIGAPNAGKSSFINWLAGREAAIVSDIPGTTRDVVEVHLVLAGLPVRVADTAGLRASDDRIEQEGVRRAHMSAGEADLRILIIDSEDPKAAGQDLVQAGDVILFNKVDRAGPPALPAPMSEVMTFQTSLSTKAGLEPVMNWLEREICARFSPTQDAGLTRTRHRDCIERAHAAIGQAVSRLDDHPELAGDDLRAALLAIEELSGRADMDAVLDRVFSRFCIGK